MKVELIKIDGKTAGWKLVAENEEDRLRLGSIRNMQFFGMNDTAIKYAGVKSWSENEDYAQELAWIQKKYREEFRFDVKKEES